MLAGEHVQKELGQYTGEVGFSYTTQRFQLIAAVAPATLSLGPGQTGTVAVTVPANPQAGDRAAALRLGSGAPDDGAIPVVVRSLVSLSAAGGSLKPGSDGVTDQLIVFSMP